MRCLVTGGAGFIGSHLTDRLIAEGHDVAVIDNLSTGVRSQVHEKARFHQTDIRDRTAMDRVFAEEKPEAMFHLAAQMDVRRSVADPGYDADVNLIGLLNLLEAGRRNGLQFTVFASSGGAIYGEQDVFPAPEGHEKRPCSPYGVSKYAGELYLNYYHIEYQLGYAAMRFANIYGPRQNPHGEAGVVAIFAVKLLRGETPTIYGEGRQTRDFVFVLDAVDSMVRAMKTRKTGAYNIGSGVETDINTIAAHLIQAAGFSGQAAHAAAKPGEQMRSCLDAGKAKRELGWSPSRDVDAGLRETMEWFRTRKY
ncbi:MAG: UDP-glucose 4-epimerase [Myxococcota bacterium]|nr:UDP-glucose 4-epimerase [Myxococcota bacterium]